MGADALATRDPAHGADFGDAAKGVAYFRTISGSERLIFAKIDGSARLRVFYLIEASRAAARQARRAPSRGAGGRVRYPGREGRDCPHPRGVGSAAIHGRARVDLAPKGHQRSSRWPMLVTATSRLPGVWASCAVRPNIR